MVRDVEVEIVVKDGSGSVISRPVQKRISVLPFEKILIEIVGECNFGQKH